MGHIGVTMRIRSLAIHNFRGVEEFVVEDLEDMVVIAGPNGCGKSSLLDAIRLVKSGYGGYQPNEWQQWFGEFQLDMRDPRQLASLLRDRSRPLAIGATIELSEEERAFLDRELPALAWNLSWRQTVPHAGRFSRADQAPASELRVHGARVQRLADELESAARQILVTGGFELELTIDSEGKPEAARNELAEVVFQTYLPEHLGLIDFYSAQRQYQREQIGGINLNLDKEDDRRSQHLLYNWQNKLQNVKSELASSYVTDLIAREAGVERAESTLQETLSELFSLFFEGKRFEGVTPGRDGKPSFPVRLDDGTVHDIDDLSSGEKEILYGYLRLRNARTRNSVILLDEPELHLNPRLVRGLPVFYQRHIGREFKNQIWLITHSDALLRESVGNPGFSVFHMRSAALGADGNQAHPVRSATEVDRAIVDIVGDLAAYRPGAPIVVLEGGGDSPFDLAMVQRLFPELADRANLIAGGDKSRVRDLYRLLSAGSKAGAVLGGDVHAIVDRDSSDGVGLEEGVSAWDVYHIENYLLWPGGLQRSLVAALGASPFDSEEALVQELKEAAAETIPEIVAHDLRSYVNRELVSSIDLGFDSAAHDPGAALASAVDRSAQRIATVAASLEENALRARVSERERVLRAALEDGTWTTEFRGRSVLKRFSDRVGRGLSYTTLRNLVLDRMVMEHYRPTGMASVLHRALPDVVAAPDATEGSDPVADNC